MNIIEYRSSYAPVYYTRGMQLPIFKLEAEQVGTFTALLLRREEDCALIPLTMRRWSVDGQLWGEESADVALSLSQLERDGWELCGHVTMMKEAI